MVKWNKLQLIDHTRRPHFCVALIGNVRKVQSHLKIEFEMTQFLMKLKPVFMTEIFLYCDICHHIQHRAQISLLNAENNKTMFFIHKKAVQDYDF